MAFVKALMPRWNMTLAASFDYKVGPNANNGGGGGNGNNNNNNFQLDIVGFLAILGEGSVETISQVASLSVFAYFPRLIPAPQTFIKPSRPEKLESHSEAKVIGIHSGNSGENIHHIAHALHRGDKLMPNTVQCVRVTENPNRPWPSIRRLGPLAWLSIIGFTLSLALIGMSFGIGDGWGLMAVLCLSLLTTASGIANKWQHVPNVPRPDPNSPPADVVIRYPRGIFIIVKCEETTARYLYFNPSERCKYLVESTTAYRGISLVSTLLLMGGVIAIANADIRFQMAFAASYIILNICYWIGAALPPSAHWDLSRLEIDVIEVHGGTPPRGAIIANESPTYTAALWKAIAVTGTKDWVREAGWAPKTEVWDNWLIEAEDAARGEPMTVRKYKEAGKEVEVWTIRNWDYKSALSTLLRSQTATTKIARAV